MDVIGIIPARFGSTRFEGKVLADLLGKPLIQHVWERASKSVLLEDLIVACDDERVKEAVTNFGAKAIFTAKAHASGTDRIIEVVNPLDVKVIINIQADEPLIQPQMIDDLARAVLENPDVSMATLAKRIEHQEDLANPNVVKVVVDKDGFALYFSRSPIPYMREGVSFKEAPFFKHIGLYAYTKDFLFTFKNLPPSALEKVEQLEQLRALENGYSIKVIETKADTIGVDTLEDLEKAKALLKKEK